MSHNNIFTNPLGKIMATTALCSTALMAMAITPVMAAEDDVVMEEVVTLGSRSNKPRSATDSPVPIDVITAEQFNAGGNNADITDSLKSLVPSFTATPATGDGSAFVRPTSMRGMAPDQTLILVNGKRRHRSALVQFFAPAAGNGAQGVDIGMIPGIALKRVEVLRDGAAAQYGSDAIAGVINFEMKDASEGGSVVAQYGNFYRGEESYRIAANAGFGNETSFVNISAEYVDNQALSRGIQRPGAQALIDAGVQGVGADSPFGDAPLVQTWGRPQTSGARFFVNSGVEVSENAEVYFHGNYAETDGRYRFFWRNENHSTIVAQKDNFGVDPGFLPAGFTPFLDGAQTDISLVGGVKGAFDNEMTYDFSVGYGKNSLDYFLNNTLNGALPPVNGQPQRDFDVGGYEQKEINLNADFSYPLSDTLNLAFGGEWREETFSTKVGEVNSRSDDGTSGFGGGSSGFAGINQDGSFSRNNYAVYVDIEQDISDAFMLQYAGRYENFSDFGGTINGKLAARYTVSDALTLRGAISSGFHAPTPGQSNITSTITTFDGPGGGQVEEGLIAPNNPVAIVNGAKPLTEEKSVNYSVGFSSSFGESTTLTVDFYRIEVNDRIYRIGNLAPSPGVSISYYTNALDTVSQGVDVVLASNFDWGNSETNTDFTFAFNYNDFKATSKNKDVVNDATIEDIENNYPSTRFVATANTFFGEKWNFMARANFYGTHYDERGTIATGSAQIGATVYFDVELAYQVTENFKLAAGAVNVFDSFVDRIGLLDANGNPQPNRIGVGLQYPRRSAANYEGGSWYLKGTFTF
ncbi:TonB-dependent receptor [hydrothermal vent metagenome]|uniref:TonB-dependent receptor n=1 Tax=hydrothermal vent metagenome TaxID=652676 RepID=A0A3B0RFZ5_9ZZZZ